VSIISSDHSGIDSNERFTTVHIKDLSNQVLIISVYHLKNRYVQLWFLYENEISTAG